MASFPRRRALLAAAPAAVAALAAACDLPAGPLAKPRVITVAAPGGAAAYEDVTAAVEHAASLANSASRPPFNIRSVRVPLSERPAGSAPLARALTPLLAGGTAPDVALVVSRGNDVSLPAGEVLDLVAGQLLAPLDDFERNDKSYQASAFAAAALDALRHQGKSYARPLSVEPLVLYYDPDLFRAGGVRPPESAWDWAMLRDAAGRLTQQSPGGQAEQWGLYSFPPLWYLLTLIWQNGGDVLAADGRTSTLAAQPAVEAMQYLYDLVAVRRVSPPPPAPNASSPYDLRYQNGRIMAGPARVAMAIGPGAPNLRQALLDYGLPDVQLGLGVAELPQGKQRGTGLRVVSALAVTAAAADKPAAYDALSRLEREAAGRLPQPARRATADQVRRAEPSLSAAHAAVLAGSLAYARVVRSASMLAAPRLAAALWQTAVAGMFAGGLSPANAAAAAARQIEEILR